MEHERSKGNEAVSQSVSQSMEDAWWLVLVTETDWE